MSHLYTAMSEIGKPAKLIRLYKLTLSNIQSSISVEKNQTVLVWVVNCTFFRLRKSRERGQNKVSFILESAWKPKEIYVLYS